MQIASLLSSSQATDAFKADVHAFASQSAAERIRVARYAPPIKVLRLIAHLLDTEPELAIDGITVDARSGCSDFAGVVDVATTEGLLRFEFNWCCRWRAEKEGWTDYFGYPDQARAAREYDFRCFASWKAVEATHATREPQLAAAR